MFTFLIYIAIYSIHIMLNKALDVIMRVFCVVSMVSATYTAICEYNKWPVYHHYEFLAWWSFPLGLDLQADTHIFVYMFLILYHLLYLACECVENIISHENLFYIVYICVCVFTACKSSLLVRSLQFMKLITLIYFFSLSQSNCYHLIIGFFWYFYTPTPLLNT